ncbi:DNA-binding response regulator [Malaciobacter halophilus]|nr:response regulator [Malaciobacter halophilus]RYA23501.1 DNA-binding response regulator [Malaciobacter halophilus]
MLSLKILKKLSNIKVLIVEDDNHALDELYTSFSYFCKNVEVANDGLEGFDKFEKNKPDIIITDISMPKLTGFELIKLVKNHAPHIPIIIITAHDTDENLLNSLDKQIYFFVRKPINLKELQTAVLMATKDLIHNKVFFKNAYTYNKETKSLYKENKIIKFTRTEKKLFDFFISNQNRILSYEAIENFVWEDKSMSIEALRMCIKKIRTKSYKDIIQTCSGQGYIMKIEE